MKQFVGSFVSICDAAMDYLDRVVQLVVTLAIAGLFVSVMIQIVMRYVFGIPLFWISELAGYLLGLLALWGTATCVRHGVHVKVLLFRRIAPDWLNHILAILGNSVVIYYCVLLTMFGSVFVERSMGQLSPSNVFDVFWPRLALPTGAALAAIQAVNLIFQEIAVWTGLKPRPVASSEE